MSIWNKVKKAWISFVAKYDMPLVILVVLAFGALLIWVFIATISSTWQSVKATENPIERGCQWVALAIVFHAIWNKHEVKVEAPKSL